MNTNEIPAPESGELRTMSGLELIAAERQRQITTEGWTPEHDDGHEGAELANAALCYVDVAATQAVVESEGLSFGPADEWPWTDEWWKPSDDPVRNLVKAGALIAAEIDRLNRRREPDQPAPAPSELSRNPLPLSERPTPRTDAIADTAWDECGNDDDYAAYRNMWNHARTLERDLNTLASKFTKLDKPKYSGAPMMDDLLAVRDPEFDAWVATLPATYWARYDLSAARIGWNAMKDKTTTLERELAELRAAAKTLAEEYEDRRTQWGSEYLWSKHEDTEAVNTALDIIIGGRP